MQETIFAFNTAPTTDLKNYPVFLDFTGIDNEEEIGEILDYTIDVASKSEKFKPPTDAGKIQLVQSARGMTKEEAENAFFYSVIKTEGKLDAKTVTEQKIKYLEATAGVHYIEYKETFESFSFLPIKKHPEMIKPIPIIPNQFNLTLNNTQAKIAVIALVVLITATVYPMFIDL